MGMNNTLNAQQTLNPFAQQMQAAINQSAANAQAQQEAALAQVATTPNMLAQQQAVNEQMAPETLAALPKNAIPNIGFSEANALANLTPQAQFQPTTIPGGAVAQGITNMFNIQERRNAQQQMLGFMQQRQAQQQALLAQQMRAAQAKIKATSLGLQALNIPEAVANAMAVNDVMQPLQNYGSEIGTVSGKAAGVPIIGQSLGQIGVPDTGAATPIQQLQVNQLMGKEANLYQNPQQAAQAGQEIAKLAADQATLPYVGEKAKVGVQQAKSDLQNSYIKNQIDAVTARYADAQAQIQMLRDKGDIQAADRKQALADRGMALLGEFQANPASMTPENLALANAVFAAGGLGSLSLPKTEFVKVKTGKNKEAVFQQGPTGLVQLTDDKGRLIQPAAAQPIQPVMQPAKEEPKAKAIQQPKPMIRQSAPAQTGGLVIQGNMPPAMQNLIQQQQAQRAAEQQAIQNYFNQGR